MLASCDKDDVLAGARQLRTEVPTGTTRSEYHDPHGSRLNQSTLH